MPDYTGIPVNIEKSINMGIFNTGISVNAAYSAIPTFYRIDKEALLIGSIIKEKEYIKRNNLDYNISYFYDGIQNCDFTISGKEGVMIFRYANINEDAYCCDIDRYLSICSVITYYNIEVDVSLLYKWWDIYFREHESLGGKFINFLREFHKNKIGDLYV